MAALVGRKNMLVCLLLPGRSSRWQC